MESLEADVITAHEVEILASTKHSLRRSGEAHHKARLTDAHVAKMRQLHEEWVEDGRPRIGSYGYGNLAKLFDCAPATARDICKYKTRK